MKTSLPAVQHLLTTGVTMMELWTLPFKRYMSYLLIFLTTLNYYYLLVSQFLLHHGVLS